MLQRPRTYQAKKYIPVVSAALDPYEEERNSLVDDERLDRWFRYVEGELRRFRSPFVAAEALLTEMRLHCEQLYQPERLYVNTALRVLQACVPHLPQETADAASAAVHELLPCLVYTRRTPLSASGVATTSGSSSSPPPPPRAYSERVTQLTYAAAFRRVLARRNQFQVQLAQQERHVRVEVKVMDHLVHELDHMWVKTCFYSWRTYCRQLQVRKAQLRRRLVRATANESAPRYLRAWRRYAHTIALNAKTSRTSALQQQVEALYPLEHEAKSRHDHLSEEIKEKSRLAGESLQRLEETQDRLHTLEELITETQLSLAEHWSTWKECVHLLFGDVGKLPSKSDRTVRTDYLVNITDTAAFLEKRARTKASRQGIQHVGKLLLYENALGPRATVSADDNKDATAASAEGGNDRSSFNDGSQHGGGSAQASFTSPLGSRGAFPNASSTPPSCNPSTTTTTAIVAVGRASPTSTSEQRVSLSRAATTAPLVGDVNRVYAAVAAVARPVLSPLHLTDVLHHNEPKLNLTVAFLSTLYSGGHCSLFMPALRLSAHLETPNACNDLALIKAASAAATTKAVQDAQRGEEIHWGALMVQDVSDGMRKVQRCTDANERYLLSVRQCMMSSELEVVQGYLEDLFARFAATGVPLSQTKLESVWEPIVSAMELPIIKALYPAQGILSFAELVDYVTRVAEYSGRPLLTLAERLDATYPYDPLDELLIFRRSEEAAELFRRYAAPVSLLFDWLKDDIASSQFRADRLTILLEEHLELSSEEATEVCDLVQQQSGDVVDRDDVEWLLLMASPHLDPSPFSTPLDKVSNVLLQCSPLFTELGKESSVSKSSAKR
ncbi:putative mitochondrial hypothetical protein [Leptomonas pyrrhocoris]|uniref:Uncharacterized protein n=1 Tax=Leptomonas pyrrhocoris TaxID=157538 RepID=A0A0N0DYY6_LEPPY|nr:putative mitochondrial hypothetical protein [Leptomonas pyrrhocoris]KPA84562.1 putative mitochondrial hypothetical protein [Leptomonas pyrrhocoris]|eukprot:XP_015663001.1 putative mitochondrial hypothetical protein [Leptomonas pyrrhocoris]